MPGAYRHMRRDHMLRDSCEWRAYIGKSEAASTANTTESFAASATVIKCMERPVSHKWYGKYPDLDEGDAIELFLPIGYAPSSGNAAVISRMDKVTKNGIAYRVKDYEDWQGGSFSLLLEHMKGA